MQRTRQQPTPVKDRCAWVTLRVRHASLLVVVFGVAVVAATTSVSGDIVPLRNCCTLCTVRTLQAPEDPRRTNGRACACDVQRSAAQQRHCCRCCSFRCCCRCCHCRTAMNYTSCLPCAGLLGTSCICWALLGVRFAVGRWLNPPASRPRAALPSVPVCIERCN